MVWRRIAVFGPTGSGKTRTARRIGERLNLPVIELDALFWKPNWQQSQVDPFRARVIEVLDSSNDGWVCDGNYTSRLRDIVLPRADLVVWLRPPFVVAFGRLLRRTVSRAWTKEPMWGTNTESWRQAFLSRDSLLLWAITHWPHHQRSVICALREVPHDATLRTLRSSRQVDEFLASLEAGCTDQSPAAIS